MRPGSPSQPVDDAGESAHLHRVWHLRVDTGGTFTDCLALDPDGHRHEIKVLSTSALRAETKDGAGPGRIALSVNWNFPDDFFAGYRLRVLGSSESLPILASTGGGHMLRLGEATGPPPGTAVEILSPEEAPLLAARMVTGARLHDALPPVRLRLATTRGTNALLQKRGARTALLVTAGFADLLRIGTQQRPDLFALHVVKPEPLPALTLEVHERLAADGRVLRALDEEQLRHDVDHLRDHGVEAVAIALLHSHVDPAHELRAETIAREAGFEHVTRSSAAAPFQQLLLRAQTAVVDAYLSPVVANYLRSVERGLGRADSHLRVMTSAGGLVSSEEFRPRDSLLSGPAGGVVGAAAASRAAGFERVLSLDMGGTSTDVARFHGDFEYTFRLAVGDGELLAPALAIETVAAGGGSICEIEQGRLVVGPHSAGASPGSACYGAGGPLTLTDVNLLLGRIRPERLPIPVDVRAARVRLEELRGKLCEQTGETPSPEELLEGWLRIADERMAEAIRRVSLRRGHDPRDHALLAFGGAGGQHACAIAELLGIRTVLAPPSAGVLSAMGLHAARLERFVERQILAPLEAVESELGPILSSMTDEAEQALVEEGAERNQVTVERRLFEMRYAGQDSTLTVELEEGCGPRQRFEQRHEELFAHRPAGRPVELVAIRVVARARPPLESARSADAAIAADPSPPAEATSTPADAPRARAFGRGQWLDLTCVERTSLAVGARLEGPALVVEDHALFFLAEGWSATVHESGCLVARRGTSARDGTPADASAARPGQPDLDRERPEAVTLELFRHRFESIAREMGEQLRRTALSTNIKERLDFSCALLDADGRLVVNAPHIPVHLGALGLCVRRLRESISMDEGDVVVTNHPAYGGSHLPDVTVATRVHDQDGAPIGFVAVRAHHAEIGGITPGSMPSNARSLAEEGVVLPPLHLVRGGIADWSEVERLLCEDNHPTRALADNLADLRGMVAAARDGARRLGSLARHHGPAEVRAQMDALRSLAGRHVRAALRRVGDGRRTAADEMDDGSPVRVAVEIADGRAVIDFSGSADVHSGNLNATEAIVRSAVLYALRLLVSEPLPLNEGLMDAVRLILPRGMLKPDFPAEAQLCPAIVGGNVETSQRVVDVLLRAFGLVAASQGTMNNVTFGNDRFGYYETLGGGTGAGEGHPGASGVHSHMTNTRLTDVEVLEHRYPVRVHRLALRAGSGGRGRWPGGDGMERELEFLAPVTLSILSQRRERAPYGMSGGEPGAPGEHMVIRSDGSVTALRALDRVDVGVGDRFLIRTPGGGGFGAPGSPPRSPA